MEGVAMAKKGRPAKRSTEKTRKRRRSMKRLAAKGRGAFAPDGFQRTAFQSEAVRSTAGPTKPPEVPRAGFTPTAYPGSPHGTVIVNNHVTINIRTDEFRRFNTDIELLIRELRYSNEISGEVRDQVLSELKAGREIITGSKPQRDLVDLLLVKPLKWLAEKSGSAIVSKLAGDALEWLIKMLH
jgi:hypothetical protein